MTVKMAFRDRESACSPKITKLERSQFSAINRSGLTKIYDFRARSCRYNGTLICDDIIQAKLRHILTDALSSRGYWR